MMGYWHHNVVYLSVCLSIIMAIVRDTVSAGSGVQIYCLLCTSPSVPFFTTAGTFTV